MDAFYSLMTGDTTVFDVTVHNWLIALGGVVVLWSMVLLRDL